VVTGCTSGIGRRIAPALAGPGVTVFLVARDRARLDAVASEVARARGSAIPIVVDLGDLSAVTRAAREMVVQAKKSGLRLAGIVNNAGMQHRRPSKTADGLDLTYTVNHLSAFALTDALMPALAPGAVVLFTGSGTEDPDLANAAAFGFRGARFLSVAECARGSFAPGGSSVPGLDAYATSKLCNILTARGLARETAPERVRFVAFDPGLVPGTGLAHGEVGGFLKFAWHHILPLLAPFKKGWSSPARAAGVVARLLREAPGRIESGTYVDDGGLPQPGSTAARDDALAARVVSETRAFLESLEVRPRTVAPTAAAS